MLLSEWGKAILLPPPDWPGAGGLRLLERGRAAGRGDYRQRREPVRTGGSAFLRRAAPSRRDRRRAGSDGRFGPDRARPGRQVDRDRLWPELYPPPAQFAVEIGRAS